MSCNRLRGSRVSFRVGSDRVQVEDILETFGGEDHDSTEQWPTLEEIRDAQQRMTAEEGAILGITERDGLWYAPQGEGIFVPTEPDDLRIRLLVVGYAGHAGHCGMDITKRRLAERFWWPTLVQDVETFVRSCLLCIKSRGGGMIPRPMGRQLQASKPRELIHFDFLKMILSDTVQEYLLVLKDGLSGFTMLFPCQSCTTAATVEGLLAWFSIFGVANTWVSDRGTHFRNQVMTILQRRLRVLHHFVTAGCAWANGTVERANREALRVFRTLLAEATLPHERWPELVPVVQATLNATSSVGRGNRSPFEIMFGEQPPHPLDAVLGVDFGLDEEDDGITPSEAVAQHCTGLSEALEAMIPAVQAAQDRRHQHNATRAENRPPPDFELGDFVLVLAQGRRHKLQMRWLGPRRVVDTVSEFVYVVEDILTQKRTCVHVSRLKRYADGDLNITVDVRDQVAYDEQGLCVEAIQRWKNTTAGIVLLVRWLGFSEADDTWEPLNTLYVDIPDMICDFAKSPQCRNRTALQEAIADLAGDEADAAYVE